MFYTSIVIQIRKFVSILAVNDNLSMKKTLYILLSGVSFGVLAQDYIQVTPANYLTSTYSVPDGTGRYKVLKHNTLYSIATLHGMTVEELKKLNGLSNNTISVGQLLIVNQITGALGQLNAVSASAPPVAVPVPYSNKNLLFAQPKAYTPASNHLVFQRARELKDAGQDLDLLKGAVLEWNSEKWYIAGEFDNFHTVSDKYDMGFDELKNMNEMNDYFLHPGMVLKISPGTLSEMTIRPEDMDVDAYIARNGISVEPVKLVEPVSMGGNEVLVDDQPKRTIKKEELEPEDVEETEWSLESPYK